jgi:hypothetical protein
MPQPPRYMDSPIFRFLGACLLILAVAFAALWYLGLFR